MTPARGGGWDTGKVPLEICPDPSAHNSAHNLATPQPEAGLDAAWAAVEALRAENERLREFLALRPSGHTGSMTERIPWFIHCGISHGENRPDCLVCAALREPKPHRSPDTFDE